MDWHKDIIEIATQGKGLYPFTDQVEQRIRRWAVAEGMCFLYVQHTSASLTINENYDPSAQADLEEYMQRIAPEGQDWYSHTIEGPDDSTAHIRTMLTQPSLSIPIDRGRLSLGEWQGIYLFEHRSRPHRRRVLLRCLSTS